MMAINAYFNQSNEKIKRASPISISTNHEAFLQVFSCLVLLTNIISPRKSRSQQNRSENSQYYSNFQRSECTPSYNQVLFGSSIRIASAVRICLREQIKRLIHEFSINHLLQLFSSANVKRRLRVICQSVKWSRLGRKCRGKIYQNFQVQWIKYK